MPLVSYTSPFSRLVRRRCPSSTLLDSKQTVVAVRLDKKINCNVIPASQCLGALRSERL